MDDLIESLIEKGDSNDFVTCNFILEHYLQSEFFKRTWLYTPDIIRALYTSSIWTILGGIYCPYFISNNFKTCPSCGKKLQFFKNVYKGVRLKAGIQSSTNMCNCVLFY